MIRQPGPFLSRLSSTGVLRGVDRAGDALLAWPRSARDPATTARSGRDTLARTYLVGNGSILATANSFDQICELYLSPLGPEHQVLRQPTRLGLAIDRDFHWLPDHFEVTTSMAERGPFGESRLFSREFEFELRVETFVDIALDVLVRRIHVRNLAPRDREVSLYVHHDLRLTAPEPRDAAFLDPETGGIVHHGGRRCVLVNMETPLGIGIPLARLGARDEAGGAGAGAASRDGFGAGPGEAEGLVDSVAGAFLALRPESGVTVDLWLALGGSYAEVRDLDRALRLEGIPRLLARTRAHWALWSATGETDGADLPEDVARLRRRSLWILRLHQDRGGAILSGLEADPGSGGDRRFAWLRDGAIAADALGRAGYGFLARRYFGFCAKALREAGRTAAVFAADGSVGAAPRRVFAPRGSGLRDGDIPGIAPASAAPAPLDGLSLHLWALARQFERDRDVEFLAPLFESTVAPLADTLVASLDPATRIPGPAPDPWDERTGFHAAVAAAVIGGLRSAARMAVGFGAGDRARRWAMAADEVERALTRELCPAGLGRFARSITRRGEESRIDATPDASLLWLSLFGDLEPEDARVGATVEAVRERLWIRSGPGGLRPRGTDPDGRGDAAGSAAAPEDARPSVSATLWLALHSIRTARTLRDLEPARTILLWCAARAGGAGLLPERLAGEGAGETRTAAPHMPAHAWLVWTVAEYEERYREIQRCERCGGTARGDRQRPVLVKAPLPGIVADL